MRVLRRPRLLAVLAVAAGLCAAHARAGVNTWTGLGNTASVVAADPHDPYVVYAVFYPGDLVRSADGPEFAEGLEAFLDKRDPVFGSRA